MKEAMSPNPAIKEKHDKVASEIYAAWDEIVTSPEKLTDLSEQKVMFCAGGALTLQFGDPDSPIWQAMVAHMENNAIEVAGVSFSKQELEMIGDFYRFMHGESNGYTLHCIDERLEGDEDHLEKEVHVGCGACAAVGAASKLENVEDLLLELSKAQDSDDLEKQPIYADMPNHDSMVVLVDLHGSDVVLGEARTDLKDKHALPFNVSINLQKVAEYVVHTDVNHLLLVRALVKWNAKIAQNIIAGHHNDLHEQSQKMLLVVDTRNSREELNLLQAAVFEALDQELGVPEDQTLVLE